MLKMYLCSKDWTLPLLRNSCFRLWRYLQSLHFFPPPLSEGQKLLCNLEISVSIPLRLTFFPHICVISEPQCQSSEMEDQVKIGYFRHPFANTTKANIGHSLLLHVKVPANQCQSFWLKQPSRMVSPSKRPERIEESILPVPHRLGKFLSHGKSTCLVRFSGFVAQ